VIRVVSANNTTRYSYPVPTVQCSQPLNNPPNETILPLFGVDPQWQRKFTIIWPTGLGFFMLLSFSFGLIPNEIML